MTKCIQWGKIVLHLDNEEFRRGFLAARLWYFQDIYGEDGRQPEEPQRATSLSSEEILHLIVMPDEQGCYHFDAMGDEDIAEYLGYFLGYMSGPLASETAEEMQQRLVALAALPDVEK